MLARRSLIDVVNLHLLRSALYNLLTSLSQLFVHTERLSCHGPPQLLLLHGGLDGDTVCCRELGTESLRAGFPQQLPPKSWGDPPSGLRQRSAALIP